MSTIATLTSQETGAASLVDINNNYAALNADKAETASPTFTGTVVLPATTSVGNVSNTEIGYLDGVTSALQAQIDAKGVGTWTDSSTSTGSNKTFVAPALGTPASGVMTNVTGTAASLTAGNVTTNANLTGHVTSTGNAAVLGSFTVAQLSTAISDANISGTNTGDQTSIAGITGTMAQFDTAVSDGNIVYQSGALGTPASGTATNITGLPAAAILPGTLAAGTYLLAENASIGLDPAGSADGKYTGITITGTGGATIAFGRLVYLKAADSQWYETDADAIATSGVMIGMTVTTTTDNNPVTVLLIGQIRADASFPALTVGAPVYVGETVGDIQVAIPTGADAIVRVVGFALTDSEIYFNPSQDNQSVVA